MLHVATLSPGEVVELRNSCLAAPGLRGAFLRHRRGVGQRPIYVQRPAHACWLRTGIGCISSSAEAALIKKGMRVCSMDIEYHPALNFVASAGYALLPHTSKSFLITLLVPHPCLCDFCRLGLHAILCLDPAGPRLLVSCYICLALFYNEFAGCQVPHGGPGMFHMGMDQQGYQQAKSGPEV